MTQERVQILLTPREIFLLRMMSCHKYYKYKSRNRIVAMEFLNLWLLFSFEYDKLNTKS